MSRCLTQVILSRLLYATIFIFLSLSPSAYGNQDGQETIAKIESHIEYGEIAKAIELTRYLPAADADRYMSRIAEQQSRSGNVQAATKSIARISDDRIRYHALFQRGLGPAGLNNFPNAGQAGNAGGGNVATVGNSGGVTEADFQPLINLIKSAIATDSWDDVNGDGSILAYPTGVFVDASGTLQKLKLDAKRNLKQLARQSNRTAFAGQNVRRQSALRKVSLNRLERRAQLLAATGRSLPLDMLNLAGIYHVKYVMYLPESNDIVIAGPAGPWQMDVDGHYINVKSGKPVVNLDDLVACLRNAQGTPLGNGGKFGCAITPRKENLAATKQFMATSKLKGKAWRKALRETLGKQDISVFGMDPANHAGRVLVEADYRMKLVAMGIEPSIPEIPSYMQRLRVGNNGQVSPMDVVRLWFTMKYDEVVADANRHVFELHGTGVQVLSENEFIADDGNRIHTGKSDGPTAGFARDFTKHFEDIANKYPVYWRLKNLFDMAIVSAIIRSQRLDQQAGWELTYFGNAPEFVDNAYRPATAPVPREVDSVMNHRTISFRKPTSTVKHTLIGVSGGIAFDAQSVLRKRARVAERQSDLTLDPDQVQLGIDQESWWWD